MNIRTQIMVAVFAAAALFLLIYMIRGNRLKLKYALSWFVLAVGILIFGCFPSLTSCWRIFWGLRHGKRPFLCGFCFS